MKKNITLKQYEIRADYDKETITVYQAYNKLIAEHAIKNKHFSEPFSWNRMTWIKPSFLWMMERCGYGQKPGQEYILGIKIKRIFWDDALMQAVLTHAKTGTYFNVEEWSKMIANAKINVQWDPERSLRGKKLNYRSIQVGISRHLIREYTENWIVDIKDYTPLVHKIYILRKDGEYEKAKKHLPVENVYPVSDEIKKRLGMD